MTSGAGSKNKLKNTSNNQVQEKSDQESNRNCKKHLNQSLHGQTKRSIEAMAEKKGKTQHIKYQVHDVCLKAGGSSTTTTATTTTTTFSTCSQC